MVTSDARAMGPRILGQKLQLKRNTSHILIVLVIRPLYPMKFALRAGESRAFTFHRMFVF